MNLNKKELNKIKHSHIVEVSILPLPRNYSYIVPEDLKTKVQIGDIIEVPLGRRRVNGFVVNQAKDKDLSELPYKLKPIFNSTDLYSSFLPEQMKLFKWMADYYGESLSVILDTAIPSKPPIKFKTLVPVSYTHLTLPTKA